MRDVFYTILLVWIIWRVLNSIKAYGNKASNSANNYTANNKRSVGETKVEFIPPAKKKISDDEGEYVNYEEIKN